MQSDNEQQFEVLKKQHEIIEEKIRAVGSRNVAASDAFFQLKGQFKVMSDSFVVQNTTVSEQLAKLAEDLTLVNQQLQALSNKIDANLLNRVNKE